MYLLILRIFLLQYRTFNCTSKLIEIKTNQYYMHKMSIASTKKIIVKLMCKFKICRYWTIEEGKYSEFSSEIVMLDSDEKYILYQFYIL